MELTGILFLVVVLLCFTLFVFALVKGFSGWGVLYTIVLVFTFLSCLTFLFGTAGVASRRIAWVKIHDQLKTKVEKLEAEARLLKYGDIYRPTADLSSLLAIANEVSRLTVERGRVWRGATLTEFKSETIRLSMAAKPPADPAAAAANVAPASPEINGDLPVENLVYVFSEGQVADGKILPKAYAGEFVVAESQGGSALLRPVVPLTSTQIEAIKNSSTFTVFEMLPLDSHIAFAESGSKRTNEAEFGRMDEKSLSELLKLSADLLTREPSQLNADEARQAKLLRSYVIDGTRSPENEPPENVWYRIEFLEDYVVDVDVTKGERKATDGGYFDPLGRAMDARLKRVKEEGNVTFKKGQQVAFAKIPADQLIDQGKAKKIEPIFVRPLNDYSIGFNEARFRMARTIQDAEAIKRNIAQVEATNKVAQEQVVFRQNERQLLDKDKAQYEKERTVIEAEAVRLTIAVQQTKAELSKIYRASQEHYDRLVKTQQALQSMTN